MSTDPTTDAQHLKTLRAAQLHDVSDVPGGRVKAVFYSPHGIFQMKPSATAFFGKDATVSVGGSHNTLEVTGLAAVMDRKLGEIYAGRGGG